MARSANGSAPASPYSEERSRATLRAELGPFSSSTRILAALGQKIRAARWYHKSRVGLQLPVKPWYARSVGSLFGGNRR